MTGTAPVQTREVHGSAGVALTIADAADRAVGAVCRAVILITGIALLAMLTANVVARYALDSGGFRFAQEVPERLFPWLIMAGVALAVQKGGHMAVETLLSRLNRRGARLLLLFGHAIVIASYVVLCWEAIVVADIVSIEHSPVLGMPSSYSYYALAAGCVGVIITTLTLAVRVAVIGPEAMPTPSPEEAGT